MFDWTPMCVFGLTSNTTCWAQNGPFVPFCHRWTLVHHWQQFVILEDFKLKRKTNIGLLIKKHPLTPQDYLWCWFGTGAHHSHKHLGLCLDHFGSLLVVDHVFVHVAFNFIDSSWLLPYLCPGLWVLSLLLLGSLFSVDIPSKIKIMNH